MDTRILVLTTGLVAMLAVSSVSAGQQEGHQPTPGGTPVTAQVAQCRNAQPAVAAVIEEALKRLDQARQTNSPSVMRAAADDLQSALLDMRAQLAPCAVMQTSAAEPHTGHTMPNVPQAPTTGPPSGAGGLVITFRSVPDPPRWAADNEFEVTVTDPPGKPFDGAEVSLVLYMPAMPAMKMAEMRNEVRLSGAGNGKYTGKGQVMMAGLWSVTVSIKQNGKEIGQRKLAVTAK